MAGTDPVHRESLPAQVLEILSTEPQICRYRPPTTATLYFYSADQVFVWCCSVQHLAVMDSPWLQGCNCTQDIYNYSYY